MQKILHVFMAFAQRFWCQHRWIYQMTIRDQNLRAGYDHESNLYLCPKCGKTKTEEVPGSATTR